MMKKQLVILLIVIAANESYSQKLDPMYIDSIVSVQNMLTHCYQYDYSALKKNDALYTRFDFTIDTTKRELLKVIYTEEGEKAIIVYYHFYHNKLIKVTSMTRDDSAGRFPVGIYYFFDNKLVKKTGKDLSLQNEQVFKNTSFKNILKQQNYLLAQFHDFIDNRSY